MQCGRYTSRVQGHIVSDEVFDPPKGRENFGGRTSSQNLQLLISDPPGGSIDLRFRVLPNYFGLCCYHCTELLSLVYLRDDVYSTRKRIGPYNMATDIFFCNNVYNNIEH